MLNMFAPWTLGEVLAVHILRLLVGFLLVRLVYPAWFEAPQWAVEITDRVVMIALVWLAVRKHGGRLTEWGLPGKRIARNLAAGMLAGMVLLAVSVFSEHIHTTVFFLAPTQHPLISQVEQALSWRGLILPLFLGGVAAPVAEEMLYRLFTFSALKSRFGLWGGAIVSAAVFALLHFSVYWLAELLIVGVALALLYHWTGSLLSAIVAHSFINTAKMLLLFFHIPLL